MTMKVKISVLNKGIFVLWSFGLFDLCFLYSCLYFCRFNIFACLFILL